MASTIRCCCDGPRVMIYLLNPGVPTVALGLASCPVSCRIPRWSDLTCDSHSRRPSILIPGSLVMLLSGNCLYQGDTGVPSYHVGIPQPRRSEPAIFLSPLHDLYTTLQALGGSVWWKTSQLDAIDKCHVLKLLYPHQTLCVSLCIYISISVRLSSSV